MSLQTLGCKLNQFETDAIAAGFRDLGWRIAGEGEGADAHIINTCTVTDRADRKSQRALSAPLGQGVVVVTGCYAESARERLESQAGVTYVVANHAKNQIPALVDGHFRGEIGVLPPADRFAFPVHERVFHTRASLKVQDGCDNFCTFCIIPSVRGRAVSRPFYEVVDAAKASLDAGRKELVLTGVNLGRWSDGTRRFADLVGALLELPGEFRLRITSLEPEGLDDFIPMAGHPKLCPHLHLCLQSGSPRVLLAMRREYSLEQYELLVARLRSVRPGLNVTTDLMVGFPGETEQEFELTRAALVRLQFGGVHVFPFSPRRDTRADRMPGPVAATEKFRRARQLEADASAQRLSAMKDLLKARRTILVETPDAGRSGNAVKGLTEDYFPVTLAGTAPWNHFVRVTLTGVDGTAANPRFLAAPAG